MKLKWWHVTGLIIGGIATYEAVKYFHQDLHRPMITYAKENYSYPLRIVEIGVFHGANSKRMFDNLNVEKMYLIDPYERYQEYSQESFIWPWLPSSFDQVLSLLGENAERTVPLQMTSEDAASIIPDGLDMVYIDGNHSYAYVKKDIELYYPKVKSGGIIGGHDIDGNWKSREVTQAVHEFADAHNLDVFIESPDWWIIL